MQLKVVLDGHTSEICSPLHDLIFEVDDPVLAFYFPPNHFNCRTTAIKLRNGVPSDNYLLPDIPEAFQNNVGATGKIFSDKNKYIENTPAEAFKEFERFQRREKDKELKIWSQRNIPESGMQIDDITITRKAIKNIYSHFTNLDLKEMVKDITSIIDKMELTDEATLNQDSHNYKKKVSSGLTGYKYYTFTWKGLLFRMNVGVMKDGTLIPYSVNRLIKKEN